MRGSFLVNLFLVDYENVTKSGLNGIENLNENDRVIIFYSVNANTLTFDMHRKIIESKAKFQFQKVGVGAKNALDFQLCSYLGYLIRDNLDNPKVNYFVVSMDHGYEVLSSYWVNQNVNVLVVSSIEQAEVFTFEDLEEIIQENQSTEPIEKIAEPVAENNTTEKIETVEKKSELEKILSDIMLDADDIAEVKKIIDDNETKTDIHNTLIKKFTSQKGSEIYKAITPLIKDKKIVGVVTPELENILSEVLSDKNDIVEVGKIINQYKTKQGINNALVKKFTAQKSGGIYKAITPLIKDKKGS